MTTVHLRNDVAEAEIALHGAELRGWTVDDVPLIWTPDPAIWADTSPLLFPVVGWTRGSAVTVGGQSYPLGLHGFARSCGFDVIEQWPSHVRMLLRSSAETEALYPFSWALQVDYELDERTLVVRLTVKNESAGPMPYACGLHPGFRWPFAGGDPSEYAILFGEREQANIPIISPDGLFMRQDWKVPVDGRRLSLTDALFEREALCFLDARSRSLRFGHRSGAAIEISVDDFPHLALWSRPAGRFLSIEAWTGHGDYVDADGDLFTKASMRHLAPGAARSHAATFTFAPPHRPVRGV